MTRKKSTRNSKKNEDVVEHDATVNEDVVEENETPESKEEAVSDTTEETKKDAEVKPAQQQQGDDDDDDWVEIEDQNSGRTYFWNRTTNTTQWNKPNTYTNVNGVKVEAS